MAIVVYLVYGLIYRVADFLRHWYIRSFRIYGSFVVSALEQIDTVFALKITLRHIFEPLYQDRSVLGYILGFIFRSLRVFIALLLYALLIALFIIIYAIWLLAPAALLYLAMSNMLYGK